jgi:hypothetical protein
MNFQVDNKSKEEYIFHLNRFTEDIEFKLGL